MAMTKKKVIPPSTSKTSLVTRKKAFIQALETNFGNVTQASMATGIPRQSYYKWRELDAKFKKDAEDTQEYTFDFVESQIVQQIKQGNTAMIIFFAKTRMRSRGYIERHELGVDGGLTFIIRPEQKDIIQTIEIAENGA